MVDARPSKAGVGNCACAALRGKVQHHAQEVHHMPSKNPRLSVVLSPSLAATLAALSQETGDSASSVVRGLLEQSEPALQRMLELMKAANAAKGQIGAGVSHSLTRVVDELQEAMAATDARLGMVRADLVSQAEAVKGRRRAGGGTGASGDVTRPSPRGSTPVAVTRGSGTVKTLRASGRAGGRRG